MYNVYNIFGGSYPTWQYVHVVNIMHVYMYNARHQDPSTQAIWEGCRGSRGLGEKAAGSPWVWRGSFEEAWPGRHRPWTHSQPPWVQPETGVCVSGTGWRGQTPPGHWVGEYRYSTRIQCLLTYLNTLSIIIVQMSEFVHIDDEIVRMYYNTL